MDLWEKTRQGDEIWASIPCYSSITPTFSTSLPFLSFGSGVFNLDQTSKLILLKLLLNKQSGQWSGNGDIELSSGQRTYFFPGTGPCVAERFGRMSGILVAHHFLPGQSLRTSAKQHFISLVWIAMPT